MRERVKWIDVVKFIGIFTIYLCHTGDQSGNIYHYIMYFNVPLFFFLSGCTENYNKDTKFYKYAWKKIKTVLLPFYFFAFLSVLVNTIHCNSELATVGEWIKLVLLGCVRETFYAYQLWFLTALVVLQLVFYFIKKLKNKILIVAISIVIYYLVAPITIYDIRVAPYNAYWAMFYMVYYAVGFATYPYIVEFMRLDKVWKKIIYVLTFLAGIVYSVLMFTGYDVLSVFDGISYMEYPVVIVRALFLTWFMIEIARMFENINLFNRLGKDTLWLCGNEWIMKTVVVLLLAMVGFELQLPSPILDYGYLFALLLLADFVVIPFEKKIFDAIGTAFRR